MSRVASHTIKGYLYQFHKTLFEILQATDNELITVEGPIEDVDISNLSTGELKTIQCKYHEAKKFVPSVVYKPLVVMMIHMHQNPDQISEYRLHAYFNEDNDQSIQFDVKEIGSDALNSKSYDDDETVVNMRSNFDVDEFAAKFHFEKGIKYDDMVETIRQLLKELMPDDKAHVDDLFYPNALNLVADLSIQHDETSRQITYHKFMQRLRVIKQTAITRWTLALNTREQLIRKRRNQLRSNLKIGPRLRYVLLDDETLIDFADGIVIFMKDFLDKYHRKDKDTHNQTPLFCLICSDDLFESIATRLRDKQIKASYGYLDGPDNKFDEDHLFRAPGTTSSGREFDTRVMNYNKHGKLLSQRKPDDFFIVSRRNYADDIDLQDVQDEVLAVDNFDDLKYLLDITS